MKFRHLGLDRIISNQPQYNMIWRVIESEVIALCEKEGSARSRGRLSRREH